jgi:ATP-binding cassette subfamily B protein
LGALALGAQRMLPLMQQIYSGWTSLNGGKDSIYDALEILCQDSFYNKNKTNYGNFTFTNYLTLDNISFRYSSKTNMILSNVNLIIPKGAIVGVVGESGAGKSTLLDLMMGLLKPTNGSIIVDSIKITDQNRENWFNLVSHVPQIIYLADTSIAENIAFSEKDTKIDFNKIHNAASIAQLSSFIDKLPNKYNTSVGEKGSKLSGGQIQRIGIARAIYKSSEFLVFDEATSALDENTELNIMKSIKEFSNDKTLILSTHRKSILKYCTHLISVKNNTAIIIKN